MYLVTFLPDTQLYRSPPCPSIRLQGNWTSPNILTTTQAALKLSRDRRSISVSKKGDPRLTVEPELGLRCVFLALSPHRFSALDILEAKA